MISDDISIPKPISITKVIDALLDDSTPFHPRYLNRLSDLEPGDTVLFANAWPRVSLRRREAILEDMEDIHMADDLLCFEAVARLALMDQAHSVRSRAIRILREYELVDLLPIFQDMAEHDPDADVRADAAAGLATYIYMGEVEDISPAKLKRVEECLLRLISSQDTTLVKRKALESLGFSSRKEVIGLIENAYNSDDMDWVITALFAMGRSANSRWKSQVLNMLTHTQPGVRAEAASAAGELEIRSSKPMLLDLLEDSDFDVRMAAIWALSQIGGKGVREALENLLETTDDTEEADQIDNALENLDFTEEMHDLAILEIPEDGDELSEDDYEDIDDDLISEDDED
jgi:HEAT repeat protein